jgi:hypothetical protein
VLADRREVAVRQRLARTVPPRRAEVEAGGLDLRRAPDRLVQREQALLDDLRPDAVPGDDRQPDLRHAQQPIHPSEPRTSRLT